MSYPLSDYGRLRRTRSPAFALVMSRPPPQPPARLQPPHVASRCVGTCTDPSAPCRSSLQPPPLTAAARDLLLRVRDGDSAPRVESYEWRMRRWWREKGWL